MVAILSMPQCDNRHPHVTHSLSLAWHEFQCSRGVDKVCGGIDGPSQSILLDDPVHVDCHVIT